MIIRCVKVKVFHPGNKRAVTHRTIAPKGKHFLAEHVEQILKGYVDKVEAAAPDQYRMVQVAPGEFNFVHDGAV